MHRSRLYELKVKVGDGDVKISQDRVRRRAAGPQGVAARAQALKRRGKTGHGFRVSGADFDDGLPEQRGPGHYRRPSFTRPSHDRSGARGRYRRPGETSWRKADACQGDGMEMGGAVSRLRRDRSLRPEQGTRDFQLPRLRRRRRHRHGAPFARTELRRGGRIHRRIILRRGSARRPGAGGKTDKLRRIASLDQQRARKIWLIFEPRGRPSSAISLGAGSI